MSNLYRVDALPALRAKIESDRYGLQSSGIINFEKSLKKIIDLQQQRIVETSWSRMEVIINRVRSELQRKAEIIKSELLETEALLKKEFERGKELEQRYINGLINSVELFFNWLSAESLNRYISPAASALERGEFRRWETGPFKNDLLERTRSIEKWVDLACEAFHKKNNTSLSIEFPADPNVNLPRAPERLTGFEAFIDDIFNGGETQREIYEVYYHNRKVAYHNAAVDYLQRFQNRANSTLEEYQEKVAPLVSFTGVEIPKKLEAKVLYFKALNQAIYNLS